jgi:hypothetical protein
MFRECWFQRRPGGPLTQQAPDRAGASIDAAAGVHDVVVLLGGCMGSEGSPQCVVNARAKYGPSFLLRVPIRNRLRPVLFIVHDKCFGTGPEPDAVRRRLRGDGRLPVVRLSAGQRSLPASARFRGRGRVEPGGLADVLARDAL